MLEMLSGAIPTPTSPFAKSLGPVDGKSMAEYMLRVSADRLYGMSELARRQHDEKQERSR